MGIFLSPLTSHLINPHVLHLIRIPPHSDDLLRTDLDVIEIP